MHLRDYSPELLHPLIKLVSSDLTEPYSVFTFKYFLLNWPELCILAFEENLLVGAIIGRITTKVRFTGESLQRGYIAMVVVEKSHRKRGIASKLVNELLLRLTPKVKEIVLETEVHNTNSLMLYKKHGFYKDKRLPKYYLDGTDAFRMKLVVDI